MGSSELNPLDFPEAWDFVELGGRENPGICKVEGFTRNFGWDVKKGKGTKGATLTLADYPPAEGTITFYLWKPDHFIDWGSYRELFKYDSSKKPASAVDIWYPSLDDVGINSVVCKSIDPVKPEGKGLWSVKVTLIEYWPPPKKDNSTTPKGSKTNADGKKPGSTGDPIADAQQAEIDRLLKEAKKP